MRVRLLGLNSRTARTLAALNIPTFVTKCLSLFLCLLLIVPLAAGFKPKWHTLITWEAFDDVNTALKNTGLAFTAEAIEEIIRSNVETDGVNSWGVPNVHFWHAQADSSKHFDDEDFAKSSKGLINLKEAIVVELLGNAPSAGTGAREKLGSALHTIQDFYSHSNRAELDAQKVLVGEQLGETALADPPSGTTCDGDGTKLSGGGLTGLTSGYFKLLTPCKITKDKCRHGAPLLCAGINKDSDSTTKPLLFSHARALARAASVRFVLSILNDPRISGNAKAGKALVSIPPK